MVDGRKWFSSGAEGAAFGIVMAVTEPDEAPHRRASQIVVPADAPGVTIERQWRVDSRPAAIVHLNGVTVPLDAVLGVEGQGATLLARTIDRASVALAADMLGGMTATFEMTLDYLKTRKQFGVPIGSFQALKHRAARLFV